MKKYQLHTKTEDILKRFPALSKRLEGAERTPEAAGAPRVLCLGADLEKAGACVAVQCGLAEPVSLGTLTRETILSLLPVLRARGWRCSALVRRFHGFFSSSATRPSRATIFASNFLFVRLFPISPFSQSSKSIKLMSRLKTTMNATDPRISSKVSFIAMNGSA